MDSYGPQEGRQQFCQEFSTHAGVTGYSVTVEILVDTWTGDRDWDRQKSASSTYGVPLAVMPAPVTVKFVL